MRMSNRLWTSRLVLLWTPSYPGILRIFGKTPISGFVGERHRRHRILNFPELEAVFGEYPCRGDAAGMSLPQFHMIGKLL